MVDAAPSLTGTRISIVNFPQSHFFEALFAGSAEAAGWLNNPAMAARLEILENRFNYDGTNSGCDSMLLQLRAAGILDMGEEEFQALRIGSALSDIGKLGPPGLPARGVDAWSAVFADPSTDTNSYLTTIGRYLEDINQVNVGNTDFVFEDLGIDSEATGIGPESTLRQVYNLHTRNSLLLFDQASRFDPATASGFAQRVRKAIAMHHFYHGEMVFSPDYSWADLDPGTLAIAVVDYIDAARNRFGRSNEEILVRIRKSIAYRLIERLAEPGHEDLYTGLVEVYRRMIAELLPVETQTAGPLSSEILEV